MSKVIGTNYLSKQRPFIIIFPDQSMVVMQEGDVEVAPIDQYENGGRMRIDLHWNHEVLLFRNGGWKKYKRFMEKERRKRLKESSARRLDWE